MSDHDDAAVNASPPRETALVTGAGRRIGRAIALALAEDGWRIAVHYNSSADEAAAVVREIAAAGGTAAALAADLGDAGETEGLVARAEQALGPVALLVNNASRFAKDGIKDLTADGWDANLAVNLRAPALLARDMAARLPDTMRGCVVNIVDQKVWNMNPDFLSYTIAKFGLEGLTRALAMALAPRVRVCGVAPGLTLRSGKQTQAGFQRAHGRMLVGRGSTVDDVVAAVRYLVDAPAITGHTLLVDGGQHLQARERDVMFDAEPSGPDE